MASVHFMYRSNKINAPLIARLSFKRESKTVLIGAKTKFTIYSEEELKKNNKLDGGYYWNDLHTKSKPKEIKSKNISRLEIENKQIEVNKELNKIENFILNAFEKTNIEQIDKVWLQNSINKYYNPIDENNDIVSNELIKNIDYYINTNKSQITTGTIKQYNTLKNKLIKYEKHTGFTLFVKDINEAFKNDFENYCIENNYSTNTTSRNLKAIKTICNYAKRHGVETSKQLDSVKTKTEKVESVYLTFDDLKKIESIKPNEITESLNNAKDWLIISCYVGQRVSDFMRFTDKMIRIENDNSLIEFTQTKTNKEMTIPLHSKVLEILAKRKGKFPRAISDQKYNDYIKEVCRIAKINNKVKGSKKIETEKGSKIFRKVTKDFKKWELVSSHIGRRSFATNFYGTIPTTLLIYVTGHGTEQMFLTYIGKSNKDLAIELTNYFN